MGRSQPRAPARAGRVGKILQLETLLSAAAECGYNATAVARRLQISLRQLQRLFSRQLGCSPRAWLREERLQAAHRLLLGPVSIKEVALSLSYRQPSQFCRDFRSRFGYTPSTLRKLHEPSAARCAPGPRLAERGAREPHAGSARPEHGSCCLAS